VTRAGTWSLNRSLEWARRLGALPPKRMIASWSGPGGSNRIQGCGAKSRAQWRAPLGSFVISTTASTKSPPQHRSPAQPEGTLSNAERRARYRARQQAKQPPSKVRYRRSPDRRTRPRRWNDAVAELLAPSRPLSISSSMLSPQSCHPAATGGIDEGRPAKKFP